MEFAVLGRPPDGPRLRLDYRRFAYAGKFVTGAYGVAVARGSPPADSATDDADLPPLPEGLDPSAFVDGVVAAVAFGEDRTDAATLWLRYVTVRRDRRGEGVGPRLCSFLARRAREWGYDRLRIAVNNPFAYEALHRAGFGFTGETTGLAELVLERPAPSDADARYSDGLDRYRERDLSAAERAFLDDRDGPPDRL
jgi:GNAT superfamily N-acetyltransferase